MGVLTWQWGCRGCWHVLGTFGWAAWVQSSVQGEGDAAVQWGPAWLCHVQGGWYWSPNVWCRVMGSVLLGPGRVDLGLGSGPSTGVCAHGVVQHFGAQSSVCYPPPGSWAGSAQRCRVCAVFGVPVGGNVVFSIQSCWSGRAEGGCVRRAGRDGHTAVLCSSPWGWMTCCAAPWAGLTALGTFGALPEPRVHQSSGAPLLHGH